MDRSDPDYPGGCTRGPTRPFAWCGGCYENFRNRANHRACKHAKSRPVAKFLYREITVERPSQAAVDPKNRKWCCPDAWFFEAYPKLAAGLCDPWWSDGKVRELWNLKISYGPDSCTVTVNDKEHKLVVFTTGKSLEDALELIERGLEGKTLAWRKSKW